MTNTPALDVSKGGAAPHQPGEPESRQSTIALAFGAPIGMLGGLIGLGGAEFRLPVLTGPLGLPARRAVSLNLLISLATIGASFAIRSRSLSFEPVSAHLAAIVALALAASTSAFIAAGLIRRVTDEWLHIAILLLLAAISGLLLLEGAVSTTPGHLAPGGTGWSIAIGALLGLAIGTVSTLLGVAGGELLIPTFVFVFGADIKTAGTASLLVSLPVVLTGVARHARAGAYERKGELKRVAAPMALASVVGAVAGGMLAPSVPGRLLKVGLGLVLLASAAHMWSKQRHRAD